MEKIIGTDEESQKIIGIIDNLAENYFLKNI